MLCLTPVQLQTRIKESNRAVDQYKKEIADLQGKIAAMRQQVVSEASVIGTTITQTFTSKELSHREIWLACLLMKLAWHRLYPYFGQLAILKKAVFLLAIFFNFRQLVAQRIHLFESGSAVCLKFWI